MDPVRRFSMHKRCKCKIKASRVGGQNAYIIGIVIKNT